MFTMNDEEQEVMSVGHGGSPPLRIKLKLRSPPIRRPEWWSRNGDTKAEAEAEDEDEGNDDNSWVCKLCNKGGFSSGRALGGHMRVHHQMAAAEEPTSSSSTSDLGGGPKKPMKKQISSPSPTSNMAICTTCTECGKWFPSQKALYGHMRCHPEREWRGILPPNPNKKMIKATPKKMIKAADPAAAAALPPKWTVRAKRGRKSVGSIKDDNPISEEMVCGLLLMLAERAKDERNAGEESLGDYYSDDSWPTKKRRAQERGDDDEEEDEEKGAATTTMMIRKKKKLKDLQTVEPQKDDTERVQYKCSTCNKSFPTHQALGGHKSSHNKFRTSPVVGEELIRYPADVEVASSAPLPPQCDQMVVVAAKAGESLHRCQICDKTFPTGQALGGHKRCHWTGPPADNMISSTLVLPPPPPAAAVTKELIPTTDQPMIKRNALEFDLNEPAPVEEERDQMKGYREILVDYPSSSSFSS